MLITLILLAMLIMLDKVKVKNVDYVNYVRAYVNNVIKFHQSTYKVTYCWNEWIVTKEKKQKKPSLSVL